MPKDVRHVNCVNIKKLEDGVQVMNMPSNVYDYVSDEVMDCDTQDDLEAICHPDKARVLVVKSNGKSGIERRYPVVKFLKNTANLISGGKFEEEQLQGLLYNLDKLEPPRDEKSIKEALATLTKIARKIEESQSESVMEEDDIDNDFDDANTIDESASNDNDDFDLD